MQYRDNIYLGITAIGNVAAAYYALMASPADVEMGDLVRILYFHLPIAALCYFSLSVSVLTGLLFLSRKVQKYDVISESAALLGLVYGTITLLTGSIWANVTWGVYWNWDPRETTTLILWLAYLGYFFLRMSVENPERRAFVAASFNVLAFLTVPLSYLSFTLWPSLHPRLSSDGSLGLTATMIETLILNVSAAFLLYIWLFRKTYFAQMKNHLVDERLSGGSGVAV